MSENETCTKCNKGIMKKRYGKNGHFLACDEFPSCKNTENIDKKETVETNGREKLIIRQCCLKAAASLGNWEEHKEILGCAEMFEAWVNR